MSAQTRRPVSMVAVSTGIIAIHSDPDYGRMGPTRFYALCDDGTMWAYAAGGTASNVPKGWQQMETIPGTAAAALAATK
jgi:hypothetical protein